MLQNSSIEIINMTLRWCLELFWWSTRICQKQTFHYFASVERVMMPVSAT